MNKLNCEYFDRFDCRSCPHLEFAEAEIGRNEKENELIKLLAPFAAKKINPIVCPTQLSGSRNKAKMVVGGSVNDPMIGIRDKSGILHSVENCPLQNPEINQLITAFKRGISAYNLTPYDLSTRRGELKYLIIFCAPQTKELMIRAVLRSKESLDRLRLFYQELMIEIPKLKVCTANIQPQHSAILEGDEEIVLSNDKVIRADLGDVALFLGPRSFYQVTSEVAAKLYLQASETIQKGQLSLVLDLFCGVGAFGQFLAKFKTEVIGVELSADAIKCAIMANKENGGKASYFAIDATEFMKSNQFEFQAIIVNPPRRGLNSTIIDRIKEVNPKMILYSSCNPQTLARDLADFAPDYRLIEFTPFDMFPLTEHLEVLAVLIPS